MEGGEFGRGLHGFRTLWEVYILRLGDAHLRLAGLDWGVCGAALFGVLPHTNFVDGVMRCEAETWIRWRRVAILAAGATV